MSKTPSISAIIPAYNSAAFIPDAIGSIRAQTHPVDEIIVVDDGSTDRTADIVKRMDGEIRYLSQANAGPSSARNAGIEAAHGDLIAFLDADDQWTTTKIEHQLAVMRAQPEIALVAGDMSEIDLQGNISTRSVLDKHNMLAIFEDLAASPIPNALSLLLKINFIPTGTVLVTREAVDEAGRFNTDIRYGEDLELWTKISSRHAIVCLPEVLMLRRKHGKNVTQNTRLLLRDLVKVALSIRSYNTECLRRQSIDPDRLVALAWSNLGYWHFCSGQLTDARRAFIASCEEKLTVRALLYGSICLMPENLVYALRRTKQKVTGAGQ